jgi:hypothetical protein
MENVLVQVILHFILTSLSHQPDIQIQYRRSKHLRIRNAEIQNPKIQEISCLRHFVRHLQKKPSDETECSAFMVER